LNKESSKIKNIICEQFSAVEIPPGAAACGAALAVSANAAWDGADSAIAGENRGIVEAVNHIVDGNAEVNEVIILLLDKFAMIIGSILFKSF